MLIQKIVILCGNILVYIVHEILRYLIDCIIVYYYFLSI